MNQIIVHEMWSLKGNPVGIMLLDHMFLTKKIANKFLADKTWNKAYKPVKVYISESEPRKAKG